MSRIRLLAFFHDPIHKALVLASKIKHEEVAKEVASAFNVPLTNEDLKVLRDMDVLASSTERLVLPQGADKDSKYQVMEFEEICFRHPLCGAEVPLVLTRRSFEFADEALKATLKDLSDEVKDKSDTEKLAYLWHYLPQKLIEKMPDIPWELLPADTRVPDHTIWDHLKLTTATGVEWVGRVPCATGTLFIFTSGPVQSFIRQARKTQDLWAGSFLLSFLTFKTIETVINKYGPTVIIYPDLQAHPWIVPKEDDDMTRATIPNRFVAFLPERDESAIREIGKEVQSSVEKALWELSEASLKELNLEDASQVKAAVKRQVNSAIATYWVALRFPLHSDGRKDYEEALDLIQQVLPSEKVKFAKSLLDFHTSQETMYEPSAGNLFGFLYAYAEKALAARKSLRDRIFGDKEPGNSKEVKRKEHRVARCHLCGERNAIVWRIKNENSASIYYFDEDKEIWKPIGFNPDVGYRELQENEALCGICLIKRFLPKLLSVSDKAPKISRDFSFPSLAEVAVSDFKEVSLRCKVSFWQDFEQNIEEIHANARVSARGTPIPLIRRIHEGTIEGEWFFEASLEEGYIDRTLGVKVSEDKIKEIRGILRELCKAVGRRPCPYYAFIAIDGDEMGKWLAGEKGFPLRDESNIYHPRVWENLPESFKQALQEIFEKEEGVWTRLVTPAFHASLAKALQTFALKMVPRIVEQQNLGQIIYVGGDDVLALVNLRDLWKVLRLLRASYSGMIRLNEGGIIEIDLSNKSGVVETPEGFWLTMGPFASLSAGVAIAHYKSPLAEVIRTGFDMEKRAKEHFGRDAFSVTWLKHSGEITKTGGKWYFEGRDVLEMAEQVFNLFRKPDQGEQRFFLSKRFVQTLRSYEEQLGGMKKGFETLLRYLVLRHGQFQGRFAEKEKKEHQNEALKKIFELWRTMGQNTVDLCNFLEIGFLYDRYAGYGGE